MEGPTFIIARVVSIVMGPWDPYYTKDSDIGVITQYQLLYSPMGRLDVSLVSSGKKKPILPMSGFINQYPLVNEMVMVFIGPSDGLNDDSRNYDLYYMYPFNVWRDSNQNAFPDLQNYANQMNQFANLPEYAGSQVTGSLFLGYTFNQKHVRNLQPFEGDTILQPRFGQSVRFGSTVKDLKKSNTWSNSGENGDPITIIVNQQGKRSSYKFDSLVEDINRDGSSIYLTSTQQINIEDLDEFPIDSFGTRISPETQVIIEAPIPFPVVNFGTDASQQDIDTAKSNGIAFVSLNYGEPQLSTGEGVGVSSNYSVAKSMAYSYARQNAANKLAVSNYDASLNKVISDKVKQNSEGQYVYTVVAEFFITPLDSSQEQTSFL